MRTFLDFEFIENGAEHPIIPISVGLVREDGKEFYAEFADVDWSLANPWVLENVKPLLSGSTKSREEIAKEILEFVGYDPEFWGYYADYDWVLMCSLYGKMIDKPESWPMYCLDIRQYMYHLGISTDDISGLHNTSPHNALDDAKWNMKLFANILSFAR